MIELSERSYWENVLGKPRPGKPYVTICDKNFRVARIRRDNGEIEYARMTYDEIRRVSRHFEMYIAGGVLLGVAKRFHRHGRDLALMVNYLSAYTKIVQKNRVHLDGLFLGYLSDAGALPFYGFTFDKWVVSFSSNESLDTEIKRSLLAHDIPSDCHVSIVPWLGACIGAVYYVVSMRETYEAPLAVLYTLLGDFFYHYRDDECTLYWFQLTDIMPVKGYISDNS